MADYFSIKVVTPDGLAVEAETNEVTLETSKGQITILPSHINYTSLLGSGILNFTDRQNTQHRFVTCNGFCNFLENSIVILTDYVDRSEGLNASEINEQIKELENKLGNLNLREPEAQMHMENLSRYRAQLDLISH